MKLRRRGRLSIAAVSFLVILSFASCQDSDGGAANSSLAARDLSCSIGKPLFERSLLGPRKGSFYSVDVLNPDVVARRNRYYMFFSGNREHSAAGDWRTGLAISRRPTGPFRVETLRGDYLNGGTVIWRGRFFQARSLNRGGGELASSRDGLRWNHVSTIPQAPKGSPYKVTADYSLERTPGGLKLYFLGRRTVSGGLDGDIASLDWRHGRWTAFRTLLRPGRAAWENLDLGEPAAFRVGGGHFLLYTATALRGYARTIGRAREAGGRWRRCGSRPLIGPGSPWGPVISIDPSPLVAGRRLYIYYGGGTNTSIASDLDGAIGVRVYRLPRRPG